MRVEETKLYKYSELSEDSQEKAREWFREGGFDYEWWDFCFDDAKEIGKILGIDISNIYFSGFSSQSDGACFEGSYRYNKGSVKAIKAYAPQDKELYSIALELSKLQRKHFYGLSAHVKHSGHYNHELCTDIHVYDRDEDYASAQDDEALSEILRDLMRWIYKRLETEWDYMNNDEQIAETIQTNEYEFTDGGRIF